jgi:GNAT superfamily N-acetyltransferase
MRAEFGVMAETRHDPIVSPSGAVCGEIRATVLSRPEDASPIAMRAAELVFAHHDYWPIVEIGWIEVRHPYNGQGVGSKALRKWIRDVFRQGIKLILLRVGDFDGSTAAGHEKADRLRRWYERIGFSEVVPGGIAHALQDPVAWAYHGELTWMYRIPSDVERE